MIRKQARYTLIDRSHYSLLAGIHSSHGSSNTPAGKTNTFFSPLFLGVTERTVSVFRDRGAPTKVIDLSQLQTVELKDLPARDSVSRFIKVVAPYSKIKSAVAVGQGTAWRTRGWRLVEKR
jgi:hypothetical protein